MSVCKNIDARSAVIFTTLRLEIIQKSNLEPFLKTYLMTGSVLSAAWVKTCLKKYDGVWVHAQYMKHLTWEFKLAIVLILLSILVYAIKFLLLGDPGNTYFYVFNALGFLPLNVLLVTLILNQLLMMRSKKERKEKLNMVIGTFFSEVGTKLLVYFSDFDPNLEKIRGHLAVNNSWEDVDFSRMRRELKQYIYTVDIKKVELTSLREFLIQQRSFLLQLLENPVLFEHAEFTEVLRAVFHLTEELESRDSLLNLPETDYAHIAGDIQRVYMLLVSQWLDHMKYLKKNYPYLFSLAMRKNPFDETASPIVR